MKKETDARYLNIIKTIGGQVRRIHAESDRKDLIFVYNMKEDVINSYVYLEFMKTLNQRSQAILKAQFAEVIMRNKVVLFIDDREMKVLKSFAI